MDAIRELEQALIRQGYADRLRRAEPLALHTTFAIGGPADLLVAARAPDELAGLVRLAVAHEVPYWLLGGGSNVLVADAGFRGLVVLNECRACELADSGLLTCESGAMLGAVARRTVEQGWSGLDWAVGVPGTVGGAVVGNAGAYGGCIADNLCWVRVLQADGESVQRDAEWLQYGYRSSIVKRAMPTDGSRPVVLQAAFQLAPGDVAELERKVEAITLQRRLRTPEGRCAGSVFKRTVQYPAGFLIEQAGLKGRRIGGAQVSEKHANFVMNVGDATAADVRALIELIQETVWRVFGQRLEPEIEFIGAWD